jgi:hypothetical protein
MSRDVSIFPAMTVMSPDDMSAVLFSSGLLSFGMSIAEARGISQRLARAADDAEHQLALRTRLRHEINDERARLA